MSFIVAATIFGAAVRTVVYRKFISYEPIIPQSLAKKATQSTFKRKHNKSEEAEVIPFLPKSTPVSPLIKQ